MVRQFLVAAVKHRFILRITDGGSLSVVQNEQTGYALKIAVGMNMAQQPVFGFHVPAGLCIGIPPVRQYHHKDISRVLLSRYLIRDVQWISCPVHLHGVTQLMRDLHGRLGDSSPEPVLLTVLRVAVG